MMLDGDAVAALLLHELEDVALVALVDEAAHVALHRGAAGQRLGAAAFAAGTARPLRLEDHVAHFAGDAARAQVELAVEHQAAADAGADEDADHGARAAPAAVGVLAHHRHAHVVVEEDAHAAQRRRQQMGERDFFPLEVGRLVDHAGRVVDAAGHADAHRAQLIVRHVEREGDAAAQIGDAADDGGRRPLRAAFFRARRAAACLFRRRRRRAHLVAAQIDADHQPPRGTHVSSSPQIIMNIFAVDADPVVAARALCDRHVVKMTLETARITMHGGALAGRAAALSPDSSASSVGGVGGGVPRQLSVVGEARHGVGRRSLPAATAVSTAARGDSLGGGAWAQGRPTAAAVRAGHA